MIKRQRFFTLIFVLVPLIIGAAPAVADNPPRKILTGWIPYYSKTGLSSAVVNADLIQDVSPFWYSLNGETKIVDQYKTGNPNVPISVPIQTLQSMNFTIIPTITDGTAKGVLSGLLAKDSARANIIATILNLVNQYGYHGIDLDFENFAFVDGNTSWPTTQPRWVQFIKELSTALHAQNKLLSVTTPVAFNPTSGKKGYYVYAWPEISTYIDRLRIMTYDYSVATPGPIGPITWTEEAVSYAVSVIPASKIFVGIPGYGRDWITAVSGICPSNVASSIKVGAKAATFVLRDAQNLAASYGATPTFSDKYGESTFNYQKTYIGTTSAGLATQCTASRTAWYQDAKSFALRANLISKYRLGGLAEWTLGMEDPTAIGAIRDLAKNIAPDVVNALITSDLTTSEFGQSVAVTGTFKLPDTRPISGLPVRLEMKNSVTDWRPIYSGVTGVDGTIKVTGKFGENSQLRFVSDGTWERLASQSKLNDLKISKIISWTAPSSMRQGIGYEIKGQIQPKAANVTIKLLINGTQSTTAVTDTEGKFNIAVTPNKVGIISAKLVIDGDGRFAQTTSNISQILVR
jgi:spore germination protein YaaH